jgi:hypothetical protein
MFGAQLLMLLDFVLIGRFGGTSGSFAGVRSHVGGHLTDFVDLAQTGQWG